MIHILEIHFDRVFAIHSYHRGYNLHMCARKPCLSASYCVLNSFSLMMTLTYPRVTPPDDHYSLILIIIWDNCKLRLGLLACSSDIHAVHGVW